MIGVLAMLVGQLLLGWLLADLVTGAFHWWEENFGDETWPVVGRWIIAPNRLHHAVPLAFTQHGFWQRNRDQIVVAAIAAWLLAIASGPALWVVSFAIGGALANEVHRYAHQPSKAPGWVRVLQQIGLCQSPREHAAHHRPPHDANFCILTDWLNPALDAMRVWHRLGAVFARAG